MHTCDECGQACDCDGEDMYNPQPIDCDHFMPGVCGATEVDSGLDDSEGFDDDLEEEDYDPLGDF